jgi:hypothetical protein
MSNLSREFLNKTYFVQIDVKLFSLLGAHRETVWL